MTAGSPPENILGVQQRSKNAPHTLVHQAVGGVLHAT
jgi:hypothetical protein